MRIRTRIITRIITRINHEQNKTEKTMLYLNDNYVDNNVGNLVRVYIHIISGAAFVDDGGNVT